MQIQLTADDLRPIVKEILALVTAEQSTQLKYYDEGSAAAMLGVKRHVLRDARLRGEVKGFSIFGGRIRYSHDDLLSYMESRRAAIRPT